MKTISISTLSKLAYADVTDWDRILKEQKATHRYRFWSYKPLREAIVSRIYSASDADGIVERLRSQTSEFAPRCTEYSLNAFATFESKVLPKISCLERDLMSNESDQLPVFGGVHLVGGPHVAVRDARGTVKWIYMHPSRDWTQEETRAFCELLLIVCESRYGAVPHDVWFADLIKGSIIVQPRSKSSVRRKCERAARLWDRLLSAEPGREAAA